MADFHVRADSVDVEQIMRQIRARIRDKRGVDYTEEQIQELARVKLERFLDPRGVRSDLLEQFRRTPPESPPTYEFGEETLFTSDKPLVRMFRRLLQPLLKLLFNPNTLTHVLHLQTGINRFLLKRTEREALYYEVMHNLVLEVTRSSIEVKNMKMRVESLSSRLDFAERRARALEAIVQYRPDALEEGPAQEARRPQPAGAHPEEHTGVDPITGGESLRTRRRRRRRGRRSGPGFAGGAEGPSSAAGAVEQTAATEQGEEGSSFPLAGEPLQAGPDAAGEPVAPAATERTAGDQMPSAQGREPRPGPDERESGHGSPEPAPDRRSPDQP